MYTSPKNSVYNRYLLLENTRPVVVATSEDAEVKSNKPREQQRKSKKNIRHL